MALPGTSWSDANAQGALSAMFGAAVAAADPRMALARHLPEPPQGRCVVVGAGKGAASMAAALEAAWPNVALSGLVITRYGHGRQGPASGRIEVGEASYPVPDAVGVAATERILQQVQGPNPQDLVLALISGGGSALLTLPAVGLTLGDKQALNRALLDGGVPIEEMNLVRRAVSAVRDGRRARAARPARLVTLLISDIPGDDPATIASGPTVLPRRPASRAEARAILHRYGIASPEAVAAYLFGPDVEPEPSPATSDIPLIASPSMAPAAAACARTFGLTPMILGDALEGESRELGIVLAGIARSVRRHGHPLGAPAVLLSGGETTVTMTGDAAGNRTTESPAMGGRNTECMLSLATSLRGEPGIWSLAGDTDGIDGNQDAAGAIVAPDTLLRAGQLRLDAAVLLARHMSDALFDALGDLVRTGATRTNVNDLRAVLVT